MQYFKRITRVVYLILNRGSPRGRVKTRGKGVQMFTSRKNWRKKKRHFNCGEFDIFSIVFFPLNRVILTFQIHVKTALAGCRNVKVASWICFTLFFFTAKVIKTKGNHICYSLRGPENPDKQSEYPFKMCACSELILSLSLLLYCRFLYKFNALGVHISNN